jgi:hypothetical protein
MDAEVYPNAAFCVFYSPDGKYRYYDAVRDRWFYEKLAERDDLLLVGYNSKHYDLWILAGIVQGYGYKELYNLSQLLIKDRRDQIDDFVRMQYYALDTYDIAASNGICKAGKNAIHSLKKMGCMFRMDIQETPIPFDQPLTKAQAQQALQYCKHDVEITRQLWEYKDVQAQFKATDTLVRKIREMEPEQKAKYMDTPARLAAKFFGTAKAEEYAGLRDFEWRLPRTSYDVGPIRDALSMIKKMPALLPANRDEDLKATYITTIEAAGKEFKVSWGGLHWAKTGHVRKVGKIHHWDAESMYPNIMIHYAYMSRAIDKEKRDRLVKLVQYRLKNKHSPDEKKKALAAALKIVVNSLFGASGSKSSALFDPMHTVAVCLAGHVLIIELCHRLSKLKGFDLDQANTDGIVFTVDEEAEAELEQIRLDWEQWSGLRLECDDWEWIDQCNISEYIAKINDTKYEIKGTKLSTRKKDNLWVHEALIQILKGEKPTHSSDVMDYAMTLSRSKTYSRTVIKELNKSPQFMDKKVFYMWAVKNGYMVGYESKVTSQISYPKTLPVSCFITQNPAEAPSIEDIDDEWYENEVRRLHLQWTCPKEKPQTNLFEQYKKSQQKKHKLQQQSLFGGFKTNIDREDKDAMRMEVLRAVKAFIPVGKIEAFIKGSALKPREMRREFFPSSVKEVYAEMLEAEDIC